MHYIVHVLLENLAAQIPSGTSEIFTEYCTRHVIHRTIFSTSPVPSTGRKHLLTTFQRIYYELLARACDSLDFCCCNTVEIGIIRFLNANNRRPYLCI